jgi:hypothetical protein
VLTHSLAYSEQWTPQTVRRAKLKLAQNGERKTHEEKSALILKAVFRLTGLKGNEPFLLNAHRDGLEGFHTTPSLSKDLLYFHNCLLRIYVTGYWFSLKGVENIFILIIS